MMQNFESGDRQHLQHQREETDRRRQTHEVTSHKNLHDSFNDDDESEDRYVRAQADKDTKYRHELKQQCDDNRQLRNQQHAESVVQRKVRQDFGTVMADQNQRYIEHQQEQTEQLRQDIISFKKECGDFKEMQRELIDIEERRIEGQQYEYSDRSDAVIAERERIIQVKGDIDENRASEMTAYEDDRHIREHDLDVKHEREREERYVQEDIRRKDEHDGEQRDLRDSLLLQIEDNKRYVREDKERDMAFSNRAHALMLAGDELEKEKARKKKEVNDQYYMDLRQQIEDNAARRKKEKEDERS